MINPSEVGAVYIGRGDRMLNRSLFVILALATLLETAPGDAATPRATGNAAAGERSALNAKETAEFEKMEKILNQEEYVWLEHGSEQIIASGIEGAEILFAGYYPESEITPERIGKLNKASLKPNFIPTDSGKIEISRLQIVWFPANDGSGARCGALMQVVRYKGERVSPKELDAELTKLKGTIANKPLTKDCNEGEPPPIPPGFRNRMALRDGFLLLEDKRRCSSFSEGGVGQIILQPNSKIDFRRVLEAPSFPGRVDRIAEDFFSPFIRFFSAAHYRQTGQDPQILQWGNYLPHTQDVTVTLRMAEDDAEDSICFVADVEQGSSRKRFVRTEPRNGRRLAWNRDKQHLDEYQAFTPMRDFGGRVAANLAR